MNRQKLNNRFRKLKRGKIHSLKVLNLVKFDVTISWDEENTPIFNITKIKCLPDAKPDSVLGKLVIEPSFLEDYFIEQHSDLLTAFQKKLINLILMQRSGESKNTTIHLLFMKNTFGEKIC